MELSKDYIEFVIKNFKKSINRGIDWVYLGKEQISDLSIQEVNCQRKDWNTIIDYLIKKGIDIEVYELCQELVDIKKLINKKSDKKSKTADIKEDQPKKKRGRPKKVQ